MALLTHLLSAILHLAHIARKQTTEALIARSCSRASSASRKKSHSCEGSGLEQKAGDGAIGNVSFCMVCTAALVCIRKPAHCQVRFWALTPPPDPQFLTYIPPLIRISANVMFMRAARFDRLSAKLEVAQESDSCTQCLS